MHTVGVLEPADRAASAGASHAPPRLRRHYVKLCDLRDFDDPALRARIREIVPGHEPEAEL